MVKGLLGAADLASDFPGESAGAKWLQRLHRGDDIYEIARRVLARSGDLLTNDDIGDLRLKTAEERVTLLDRLAPSLANGSGGGTRPRIRALRSPPSSVALDLTSKLASWRSTRVSCPKLGCGLVPSR